MKTSTKHEVITGNIQLQHFSFWGHPPRLDKSYAARPPLELLEPPLLDAVTFPSGISWWYFMSRLYVRYSTA